MSETSEIELKLGLPNLELSSEIMKDKNILKYSEIEILETKVFEAIYLDTQNGDLNKGGFAFRIRKEGEQWVATVKTKGSSIAGLHKREEWDRVIDSPIPSIEYFEDFVIFQDLKDSLGNNELISLFITKFERGIINLNIENRSKIELAMDIGEIIVGDKRELIAEVELELKSGNIEDLNLIGNYLVDKYKLIPEDKSKYHRGLLLLNK